MSKKLLKTIKSVLLILLLVSVTLLLLFVALKEYEISKILTSKRYWFTSIAMTLLISFIPAVFGYSKNEKSSSNKETNENFFQTDFRNMVGISRRNLSDTLNNNGVIVGAETLGKNGKKDIRITIADSSRTLVLYDDKDMRGKFLDNNLAVMSSSKNKPNLFINTRNVETFIKHKAALEKNGYRTCFFNLKDPFKSDRWNPFDELISDSDAIRDIKQNLESRDGKYFVAGKSFNTYKDVRDNIERLKSEIHEKAKQFAYVMISDEKTVGCRTLIVAFILAFCEDYVDGKIRKEQINLYNLKRNIVRHSKDTAAVRQYLFDSRDDDSVAKTVMQETNDEVLAATLLTTTRIFNNTIDDSVKVLTAETDVDLADSKNPIAVFIAEADVKSKTCGVGKLISQRIIKCLKDNSGKRAAVILADYNDTCSDMELIDRLGEFEGDFRTIMMLEYETCETETAMMNYKAKSDMRIYMHFDKHLQESELSAFCNTDFEKVLKRPIDQEDTMVFYKDSTPFVIGIGKDLFAEINADSGSLVDIMPTKRYDIKQLGFDISEMINKPVGGDLNM